MLQLIINKFFKYRKLSSFILGAASVLALPPHYAFVILFITFSGLLLLLDKAPNLKNSFAIGYWFGFGFFAFGFSWIGNALLIDPLHFGWLYPICLFACGAFFGLFIAFPALLSFWFKNLYAKIFAFATFWVIFEWIRSFFLTGFPWNLLGSVLAFNIQAIQLASVIGTYGLSLLVILITSAPALFIKYKNRQSLAVASTIIIGLSLIIGSFGFYHYHKYNDKTPSETIIRFVQPSIPQNMKWDKAALENNLNQYIKLSQAEGLDKVDFVLWGETASAFALDMEDYYRQSITEAIPEHGYLITGLVRYKFDNYDYYQPMNSMFVLNKQGDIENYYDKTHLVPFGEYIPLRQYMPRWVRPVTNTIANFKAGSGHKKINIKDYPSFGSLICYEIIFPAEVVDNTQKPEWLINLTNDGWYGDSSGPYQHLVTTQLRAVEEGITIARIANSGISAMISRTGEVIASLPLNHNGYIDVPLPQQLSMPTLYGKYSNIIVLILCLANITLAIFLQRKHN